MKKTYCLLLALIPVLAFCQQDSTKTPVPKTDT